MTPPVNLHDLMGNEVSAWDFGGDLQRALQSGARRVRIPAGEYRTSGLRVGSRTHLFAESGARIVFADGAGRDASCFLLSNRDPEGGDSEIIIEGGVWDGNNAANPRGPDAPGSYTGAAFNFVNVRGLVVRDVTLHNATSYHLRLSRVREFTLERIRFTGSHSTPNQDGIHVAGCCEDGCIRDVRASGVNVTGDDLVALVADDAMHRAQNLGLCCGPIRRVRIERLRAEDCHSLLRLASVWEPIEEIDLRDVSGGCRCCAINADALRYCLVPVFDARDPRFAAGVGALRTITVEGLTVHKTHPNDLPLVLLETRMRDVVLRDVKRDSARDLAPSTPLLRVRHILTHTLTFDGRGPFALRAEDAFVVREERIGEVRVEDSEWRALPQRGG